MVLFAFYQFFNRLCPIRLVLSIVVALPFQDTHHVRQTSFQSGSAVEDSKYMPLLLLLHHHNPAPNLNGELLTFIVYSKLEDTPPSLRAADRTRSSTPELQQP